MDITTEMVKELRQATNAGVMDCKKALQTAQGDMTKAVELLREKGLSIAAKKAERVAKQGMIEAYVHAGNRVASLVELNCETDFVARTDEFKELIHDLAMQVVAGRPLWVNKEDVPADVIAGQMETYRADVVGKPERIVEQILEGKLAKFYEESCLMEQPFIKDCDIKVKDLVLRKIAAFGENLVVRRFVRYELGELDQE